MDLVVITGISETGVIALLNHSHPGPTVLVRADIDALPIKEETGAEYASQIEEVMHACGHDGHTAILLAVARLLSDHRDELSGSVKFVFQPAEELMQGARRMVDEGVLENPKPDYVLALHLDNSKPVGWFGITPGPVMAGAASFAVRIKGQGGHGAIPQVTRDPIVASAQVINSLQSIISRNINPLEMGVLSVGAIHGGKAFNVIPPEVEFTGTIRAYDSEVQERIFNRLQQIADGVAQSMMCSADVNIDQLTPAVINDRELALVVKRIAKSIYPDAVIDDEIRDSASDDMAHMMQNIPGCYFFVGSSNSEIGLDAPHHDPRFDFDEQALARGVAIMAATVMELLQSQNNSKTGEKPSK